MTDASETHEKAGSKPPTRQPPPDITLLCRTSAGDGYEDLEFVALHLTPAAIEEITNAAAAARRAANDVPHFYRLVAAVSDGVVAWLANWRTYEASEGVLSPLLDKCEDAVDESEWVILPPGYVLPYPPTKVVAAKLRVGYDFAEFSAYHSESRRPTRVDSQSLSIAVIEAIRDRADIPVGSVLQLRD